MPATAPPGLCRPDPAAGVPDPAAQGPDLASRHAPAPPLRKKENGPPPPPSLARASPTFLLPHEDSPAAAPSTPPRRTRPEPLTLSPSTPPDHAAVPTAPRRRLHRRRRTNRTSTPLSPRSPATPPAPPGGPSLSSLLLHFAGEDNTRTRQHKVVPNHAASASSRLNHAAVPTAVESKESSAASCRAPFLFFSDSFARRTTRGRHNLICSAIGPSTLKRIDQKDIFSGGHHHLLPPLLHQALFNILFGIKRLETNIVVAVFLMHYCCS